MDIIDRINALLAASGKTGAEMSRDLGLSNSAYSQWNTRKTKPSKKSIQSIAEYLGATADYLMFGSETEKAPTQTGERQISDDELKFALWGDCEDIDENDLADVRSYAAFVRERKKRK